ncbi:MAG: NADH-quinone oxidoreductase subunit L, partial [Candidatus Aminicenantes bacterium]|nr:NADH-quinone oxidoreductase subunit L [Candidatus Aminicenantes bacterium]
RRLPLTYAVFLVGTVALSGVPFFSGFFSKDAILTRAFASGGHFVWALGLLAAVLTAFYMFRLLLRVFHGRERLEPGTAAHVHESPPVMTVPLVVLALFSAGAGYLSLPTVFGADGDRFSRFLESVIPGGAGAHPLGHGTEWLLILASTAVAFLGIGLALAFYARSPVIPEALVRKFPRLYGLLAHKYYVDEIYGAVVVSPLLRGSEAVYRHFDLKIIDGAVNGSGRLAALAGRGLNALQTGRVRHYALAVLAGLLVILGVLVL